MTRRVFNAFRWFGRFMFCSQVFLHLSFHHYGAAALTAGIWLIAERYGK